MTITGTLTEQSAAIAVTGLRKSYRGQVVLDGIDLTIAQGSIFSLLGPNGAGKTTAVKILSTLTTPTPATFGSRGSTWAPTRTGSGLRSASPGSSRRSTSISTPRRTYG